MNKNLLIVFIVLLLVTSSRTNGQSLKNDYRKLFDVSGYYLMSDKDNKNVYYISKNPITNREYITYLCWLSNVYRDAPEVFHKALPGINSELAIQENTNRSDLIRNFSSSYLLTSNNNLNYIFNIKYLDYPIIGLSWNQAMNFLVWLSDRYNEMALIRKKELIFVPLQLNENNFNTEAYLSGQYEGWVRRLQIDKTTQMERRAQWSDRVFIPTFRLPSKTELETASDFLEKELKPYKANKFLRPWINHYMQIDKDTLVLYLGAVTQTIPPFNTKLFDISNDPDEYVFESDLNNKFTSILDIYKEYNQDIINLKPFNPDLFSPKDSFGHMPFIIIGEDNDLDPVFVKRITYERQTQTKNLAIFRYAVNAVH